MDLLLAMVDQEEVEEVLLKTADQTDLLAVVDQDLIMVLMVLLDLVPVVVMVVPTLVVVEAVLHTPSQVAQAREVELVDQVLSLSDISSNNLLLYNDS